MWTDPLQSWAISLSLGSSSVVKQGDSSLAGYLKFEFCDPFMVSSQALARTRSTPVPVALLSVLPLGSGQGPGHLVTGEAVVWKGLGRRWIPKVWRRHLAGPSEVEGGPSVEARLVSTDLRMQQPCAKMGDLQSMGRDGAGELRGGLGAGSGGNEAQDCACLCWERTRARPLGCEARGPALPPQCPQAFESLCLGTHLVPHSLSS